MADDDQHGTATQRTERLTVLHDSSTMPAVTAQVQPITTAFPKVPTREFLDNNYRKPDLQKRCRELGFTNVWVSKSQLIDMILEKSLPSPNYTPGDDTDYALPTPGADMQPAPPTPREVTQIPSSSDVTHEPNSDQEEVDMFEMARKIKMIMSKLETKDMEIDLLNTEMKTAYHTIELLQKRVIELEQQRDDHHSSSTIQSAPNNCLLLGDTNLRRILRSDLQNNCWVRTIMGASVDLLRSWVTEKLSQIPSECVIYCGIYDILEEKSPVTILDNLGSLISDLKEKNSNMKVYICEIVPAPMYEEIQAKIEAYNEHLTKWGETNGISIIRTLPTFKLGTGELDDLCFDVDNDSYSTLNRLGVTKLLTVIKKMCPEFHLCSNWEEVKRGNAGYHSLNAPTHKATSHLNDRTTHSDYSRARKTTIHRAPHRPSTVTPQEEGPSHPNTTPVVRPPFHLPPPTITMNGERLTSWRGGEGVSSSRTYAAALRSVPEERHHCTAYSYPHTSTLSVRNNSPHYDQTDRSRRQFENKNYERKKVGCYNCGEFNHVQSNCRFDHKLLCSNCHSRGHKSRLCQYYST